MTKRIVWTETHQGYVERTIADVSKRIASVDSTEGVDALELCRAALVGLRRPVGAIVETGPTRDISDNDIVTLRDELLAKGLRDQTSSDRILFRACEVALCLYRSTEVERDAARHMCATAWVGRVRAKSVL